ncbi:related to estradiol 17-beta-dehydrogenase 8 [Lecanosticta acicola]|uniref:Related to estradiol 17-beta-dehydrogenase 8 n=1 Tax=Lecanosticta acicola TaxID=111012 RepID=A0AAI8Z191_9PEZI|nr:related to estradiol 17-beta-dehydrogenase 8 [Lecanosticta acicola]
MSLPFKSQICLITGAASGIGRATAIKLASLGATLSIQDINPTGLQETLELSLRPEGTEQQQQQQQQQQQGEHYHETFDVSSSQACNTFITNTMQTFGKIDHVFNCAGVNPTAYPLTDTTDEYFDRLVGVNLRGTYNVTRAAMAVMKEGGSMVNVSSVMGITVAAEYAIYCATKFGIVGFTKAMAMELGPKGIRVNAVAPGYINTPTNAGVLAGPEAVAEQTKKVALGRMGTTEEVADVVAFLFSDEARYVNGSIVEITGGRT